MRYIQLTKKIREGDLSAFTIFFKAEYDPLLFFVNGFLKEIELSQDIVQESFITLWNRRALLEEDRNIRALLYHIARNKTINLLKSKYYKVSRKESVELKMELHVIESQYITERIDSLSLEDLIEDTYNDLPDRIRESFESSRRHGLTNAEIAKKLGISVRAVEYHISAALKIFKEKLKDYL